MGHKILFTHTFTYMSSAILRSSFAASVRTTFSKSQRTTINTKRSVMTKAVTITEGVEFDTVAREWRMKWSPDDDKASLAAAQKVLEKQLATVKAVKGVKSVQRVVCGGCMDFKVIVLWMATLSVNGKLLALHRKLISSRKLAPSKV